MEVKTTYYVGVDVGTQSVRAALVRSDGKIVTTASSQIETLNPSPGFYEQSSNHIWLSCIKMVQFVTKNVDKADIRGIGFDATCSLVALDENFEPVSLNLKGAVEQNIILWMDHRAIKESKLITNSSHPSLKYIGGKMSPEMQPPKLMWIKKNLPSQWEKVKHFFDLPDFLTWKATGCLSRSLCSLVCKFLYQPESETGWDDSFWTDIGLDELITSYHKIGTNALSPGEPCGTGLTEKAAYDLNLLPNTPVSISIIDCHAGALGVLACSAPGSNIEPLEHRMALISGTSACHVKVHPDAIMTSGVWGPYFSAVLPQMYCTEAGQSAAGALLDHVINTHPAAAEMKRLCGNDRHITDLLNDEAVAISSTLQLESLSALTKDIHVYPDYYGNRSPLADAELTGMVSGLTLSANKEDLVKKYLATIQALAYSTRHIIESLRSSGHIIKTLIICGGLRKNNLYVQMHSDVTGLPVVVPNESESVLLGAAILAATAAKSFPNLISAMSHMCGFAYLVKPNQNDEAYHEKKYNGFLHLLRCQKEIRLIMKN